VGELIEMEKVSTLANRIWFASDILRGSFPVNDYPLIVLSFVSLFRLSACSSADYQPSLTILLALIQILPCLPSLLRRLSQCISL